MKIKLLILSLLSFCGIQAQTPTFTELSDTKPHTSEAQWDAQVKTPQAAWGSIDQRYQKNEYSPKSHSQVGCKSMERRTCKRTSGILYITRCEKHKRFKYTIEEW